MNIQFWPKLPSHTFALERIFDKCWTSKNKWNSWDFSNMNQKFHFTWNDKHPQPHIFLYLFQKLLSLSAESQKARPQRCSLLGTAARTDSCSLESARGGGTGSTRPRFNSAPTQQGFVPTQPANARPARNTLRSQLISPRQLQIQMKIQLQIQMKIQIQIVILKIDFGRIDF